MPEMSTLEQETAVVPGVVTVYTKPSCVQCNATYRALDKKGIEYRSVDLTESPKELERLIALGYQQAPIVAYDNEIWSGFRPDKIAELAAIKESVSA